jgi:hypothetical protein
VYGTNYANTSSSATTWSVSPGFDHFVADRVSLGLAIPFGGSHFEELAPPTTAGAASLKVTTDTFTFALAPRVGVDLPLSNAVSFYPRANIAFGLRDEDEKTNAAENKHSVTIVSTGLSAPLLFHFAEHAFVGFGPSVYHELSAKTDDGQDVTATSVGANLFVGGWL